MDDRLHHRVEAEMASGSVFRPRPAFERELGMPNSFISTFNAGAGQLLVLVATRKMILIDRVDPTGLAKPFLKVDKYQWDLMLRHYRLPEEIRSHLGTAASWYLACVRKAALRFTPSRSRSRPAPVLPTAPPSRSDEGDSRALSSLPKQAQLVFRQLAMEALSMAPPLALDSKEGRSQDELSRLPDVAARCLAEQGVVLPRSALLGGLRQALRDEARKRAGIMRNLR